MLYGGGTKQTTSNDRGEYTLSDLPAGQYSVQFWMNNPRVPHQSSTVMLDSRTGAVVDLVVNFHLTEQLPATPYGAPPRRRRIV